MRFLVPLAALFLVSVAFAQTEGAANARRAEAHGVSLKVTPLTRSQKTAFFTARGFKEEQIATYANGCGFSFAFENREGASLAVRLTDWAAERKDRIVRFMPLAKWESDWERLNIDKPARIAFRWAQFPETQEFARGDWIMGMANLEQRLEGTFRLVVRFDEGGRSLELPIDNVTCAPLD